MKSPSAAMQVAIHGKLTAHAAMLAIFGGTVRAYDKVPATPVYPYVRVGDDQTLPRSNACMDGWAFIATVHVFSQDAKRPRMQAKEINSAVLEAIATLASPPLPTGYVVKELELQQERAYMEGDGITAHGVVTVEYLVRPAA